MQKVIVKRTQCQIKYKIEAKDTTAYTANHPEAIFLHPSDILNNDKKKGWKPRVPVYSFLTTNALRHLEMVKITVQKNLCLTVKLYLWQLTCLQKY